MYISAQTKESLEKVIGKSIEELNAMDFSEEVKFVEMKTKKTLSFSKKVDSRMTGRGNSLLIRRRIVTIDDINKRIDKIK